MDTLTVNKMIDDSRFERIKTKEEYYKLVLSGLAWEIFPELEFSYLDFKEARIKWLADNILGGED